MARIRTIKPEFWTDEKIVSLPFEARLLFIGLWNFCDDSGAIDNSPERIRMQIFPGDSGVDVSGLLDLLAAIGLLERWASQEAEMLTIRNWTRHQKIDNPSRKAIPREGYRRLAIPNATRLAVAAKYGCKPGTECSAECYYCGSPGAVKWWASALGKQMRWVTLSDLEFDHFESQHVGGDNSVSNIVLACRPCNRAKREFDAHHFFEMKNPQVSLDSTPRVLAGKSLGSGRDLDRDLDRTDTFTDGIPPSEAPRPDGLGASEEERQAEAAAAEAKAAKRAEKEAKEADLLAMFEDFWDTYDKRVGRAPAFKAFRRIVDLEHIIPYIIEAAEKYRKATPDKQFRKHPATWLNQASWQDEIIERAAPSQPQGRNGRFFRPIEHMRNMPLGTPSCDCQGCIDYRLRRMNERNGTHG